jgi:acetyl esterase/lipase
VTGDSPASPASPASVASVDGVSRMRAVPFAAMPGYRPLELDLFRPAADGPESERPLPAVVYLHGGGWRQGASDEQLGQLLGATLAFLRLDSGMKDQVDH